MNRTTAISVGARRSLGVALLVATVIALLSSFIATQPAQAAECSPSSDTACIQGVIKTSAGEPAVGVEITVSGAEGEQTAVTNEEGRWVVAVTEAGTYTAKVTKSTLPEGQFFKQSDTRKIEVQLNKSSGVLFPLTDDPNAASKPATDTDTEDTKPAAADKGFSWSQFWQQFASGIRMGLLIALASLGLSLIFGTTGLSNFAHGEMVSMGGLLAAAFMGITGNLLIAGTLAVIALAAFGWVQDKALWKPLRKRRLSLMQMMIVSIGLSIAMQYLFQFFWGSGIVRIDTRNPATFTIFGVTLTVQSYIAMGISLLAILFVGWGLMFTRFGRATRAISDNPSLAQASGIDVDKIIRVVWTIGGALAGLAGVFLGLVFNGINWFTGGQMLLLFFAAVTLGGLGTAFGAFIGSMIIGMMVELTNIWLPGDLKYATALLLMILILLVRPQGIFGRKERIG